MLITLFFALWLQDATATTYDRFETLRRESLQAFRAGDHALLLEKTRAAHDLVPDHVRNHYNMALALALNDMPRESLDVFAELAAMGLVFDITAEKELAALADQPRYKDVVAQFEKNRRQVGAAKVAFTLSQRDFFPEGLVHDPKTGRFLIGSIHHRKIIARMPDGTVVDLVLSGQDGLWSVLGMVLDPKSRDLWAVSAAMPQTKDLADAERGQTALYRFDADTGKLRQRYQADDPKGALGDLALAEDGTVYLSDGTGGKLYRLKKGDDKLSPWVTSPMFKSPQGLALSKDQSRLYMGDWTRGLFMVNIADGKVHKMTQPQHAALIGIDGLVRHGNDLIAIQNGINPHRVVKIKLSADGRTVKAVDILEMNHPQFDEPTLGTLVGDDFYFVATSQWGRYDKNNQPLPNEKLLDIVILKHQL